MDGSTVHLLLLLGLVLAASAASALPRASEKYVVLEGCGSEDRLCMVYPDGCSANGTCTLALTVRPETNPATKVTSYLFEMGAKFKGYVAVALAGSVQMGDDAVVECVKDADGSVRAYQSVNHGQSVGQRRGNQRLSVQEQTGVVLLKGAIQDGVITCSFRREEYTVVSGRSYNLTAGSWILQVAGGDRLKANFTIAHHTEWLVTLDKVNVQTQKGLIKDTSGHHRTAPGAAPRPAAVGCLATLLTALSVRYLV